LVRLSEEMGRWTDAGDYIVLMIDANEYIKTTIFSNSGIDLG